MGYEFSESAMCGNALCSVAKLLYERGIEKKTEFSIELGNSNYPVKTVVTFKPLNLHYVMNVAKNATKLSLRKNELVKTALWLFYFSK